jgi:hypothetical protein
MAKKKRTVYPEGTAPAIYTDWAFLNKITGQAIAVFNPNGSVVSLRRTGIAVARAADLSFTKVTTIPVGLMKPEKIISSNLALAPRVTDPKGSATAVESAYPAVAEEESNPAAAETVDTVVEPAVDTEETTSKE